MSEGSPLDVSARNAAEGRVYSVGRGDVHAYELVRSDGSRRVGKAAVADSTQAFG
jgi:hypothetical protein